MRDATITASGPAREAGPLYPLFAIVLSRGLVHGPRCTHLEVDPSARFGACPTQYLILGFTVGGGGAITSNLILPLVTGDAAYSWIGPHFVVIFVAMVAHAIVRHRLMSVRLVIRRSLTFTLAVVVSLLPVVALLVLAWPRLSDHFTSEELGAVILAVVVVSLLIPLIRDVAGRLLDRYVYRTHVNYQRTLREASKALTQVLDLRVLLPFLNHTVAASTNSEGAAVYLRGVTKDSDSRFSRAIAEKRYADGQFDTPAEAPAEVIAALIATRGLMVTDEIAHERSSNARSSGLLAELGRLGWALVLPLVAEDKVIGAIVVGAKLSERSVLSPGSRPPDDARQPGRHRGQERPALRTGGARQRAPQQHRVDDRERRGRRRRYRAGHAVQPGRGAAHGPPGRASPASVRERPADRCGDHADRDGGGRLSRGQNPKSSSPTARRLVRSSARPHPFTIRPAGYLVPSPSSAI